MPSEAFSRILLEVLVVLISAKVGGEIAERLGQPTVLGELVLGVIVGPSVLGWIRPNTAIETLAQLGAILLMFEVGLETDLPGVIRVGGIALRVAAVGVGLPFTLGAGVALALGYRSFTALFLGATLTATSVGITARLLADMRKLNTPEGRTILGAAVADDMIGLVILTVILSISSGHAISITSIAGSIAAAVAFLAISLVAGPRISPPLFRWLSQLRVRGILVTASFVFCLILAYLANALRLAPIVGAFAAGIALARTDEHRQIKEKLSPLADLFVPIFFLSVGIRIQPHAVGHTRTLTLAAALALIGVLGKLAAGLAAPRRMRRMAIGVGMVPRGEVDLIFASYGLALGIFGAGVYGALLMVVAFTALLTPFLAKPAFRRLSEAHDS